MEYGAPRALREPGKMTPAQKALTKTAQSLAVSGTSAALGIGGGGSAAALTSVLGAAGVSASVPVVGWIAAGGLVAATGVIAIVRAARKKGRTAAYDAAKQYSGGQDFANAYMRLAGKSETKAAKITEGWADDLAKLHGKKQTKARKKKIEKLIDKLNAAQVVLGTKMQPGERDKPLVKGEKSTEPSVADTSFDWEDAAAVAGITIGIGLGVLGIWRITNPLRGR